MASNPIFCERCSEVKYVKPNGDCPGCGVLLTGFPGLHMRPAPGKEMSVGDKVELARFERYLQHIAASKDQSPAQRVRIYELIYQNEEGF